MPACAQSLCDGVNILGFSANLVIPTTSKFAVVRIDHDFSSKRHFITGYRYYNLKTAYDDQVDIGGFFPGDTLGTPASLSGDPQQDWYLVAGVDHQHHLQHHQRHPLQLPAQLVAWERTGDPPQMPGLGGALEIVSGQTPGQLRISAPTTSNNQQTRTRFWDGHDQMLRDDLPC